MSNTFKVIAHRGASDDAPDNGAEAFELAITQHADLIETDVRLTADGVLVLEHDAEIDGLEVRYSTLAQLREQKPHLLTVAAALKEFGTRIPFCFEVKAPGIEHALVYLVKDLLPSAMWQQTEFTSFHLPSALDCRKLAPNTTVGWLTRQWDEETIHHVHRLGLPQLCPMASAVLARPELVKKAQETGLVVRAWLVETPDMAAALAKLGLYGGTVNFPGAALATLQESNLVMK
jgi:glycerophosphoryl diester phosphodiesterase